ncbi:cation diffusion facilitator family transporter [Kovacikia minuta CCNUW1]|uniref:cation diffusion facilitator family transporter n=1 Tax=Kovacikia minuta TaxID=2931930 RepID=UPI001CCC3F57|nr:cation diffusion facilitator family transporter [Kovacikia minuta]UBF27437.1 cation diffusion facilitator family transporter [Kovacikia minuta CCNUW1]
MTEAKGRRAASRQVLLASLWLTLLVLAVKVWISWATHSLSLISESLHTLIDGFSILLSLISVSSSLPSGREGWGHSRLEAAISFLLVAFLGFACVGLLAVSLQQLESIFTTSNAVLPVKINPPLLQLLGVVMAISFCLASFERYQARVLDSIALRFNAKHLFQDSWLMIVVLAGLVGVWSGSTWLDPALAIVMVITAIASCCRVFAWQLPSLLRQIAIAPEALAQTIHQVEGITHCYAINSRGLVGRQVFVEMHLILHPECMGVARSIAERVEQVIRDRYGPAKVVIYIDSTEQPKNK